MRMGESTVRGLAGINLVIIYIAVVVTLALVLTVLQPGGPF
jgi:hypothetical protein